jgi:hypothetical protein
MSIEGLTAALTKIQVFWAVMPCQLVKEYRRFERAQLLQFKKEMDCLTLKMKALRTFELSVTIYQSARRNIAKYTLIGLLHPEDEGTTLL